MAQCEIHADDVACPMLLFCLQTLNEFIAYYSFQCEETWRMEACKLAQSVFVARWDAAVLNQVGRQEIDLQEYLLRKKTLVGVSYEVWRIVGMYWDKYKQNYLHQHELCLADHHVEHNAQKSAKWNRIRDFFHASKLADVDHSFAQIDDYLASKQLSELLKIPQSSLVIFKENPAAAAAAAADTSDIISQSEWKIAFNAIVIRLQRWIPGVYTFPCGSFSRGAAYGSTIDILVALPEEDLFASREKKMRSGYDGVVAALSSAKIVQQDSEHRVSATRGLFIVPYKTSVLIFDLKAYEQPKSWFALLCFTGPQHFVHDFYCSLLQISLQELLEATFDAIYTKTVAMLRLENVASVECEKDIFDLAGREYLLSSFRM
uniref:DNA polymerase n=1 Tax=Globisporangium ultimum (strain ATCC 200006 / CBS 805.95 / DAOM BR144) TaxID=431595 RepID=K3WJX4_GLOUD